MSPNPQSIVISPESNLVRLIFIQGIIKDSTVQSDPANPSMQQQERYKAPPTQVAVDAFQLPNWESLGEYHVSTLLGQHLPINTPPKINIEPEVMMVWDDDFPLFRGPVFSGEPSQIFRGVDVFLNVFVVSI